MPILLYMMLMLLVDRSNGDGSDEYTKCSTAKGVGQTSWTQSYPRKVQIVSGMASFFILS
jgi:hypothetical protein